ncbi:hypothetical protein [Pelomonas sp. SE-A7]|uniref:hypothetical protein n=1 Tax=Pelomonas sp. SE-A7 TaxID=3054953 RepID=UPI00259D1CCE|nr:hypothetical protein [Pelomonas sp. SE-A7]MDM4768052.1 hypothetical protein [Pelomonas sp. SE-A7]
MYPRAERYFALALLITLIGFFPTYFSRVGEASSLHHIHGLTATGWMLCLITQAWLMRTRRLRWHRLLGWTSLVLAVSLFVSGLLVVRSMLGDKGNRLGPSLAFIDFVALGYFALAITLALVNRKRVQLHARYMASTVVLVLPPALARVLLFFVAGFTKLAPAVHGAFVLSELVVVLLLLDDRRRGAGFSKPYLGLMAATLLQHAGFTFSRYWPAWGQFTAWYAGL